MLVKNNRRENSVNISDRYSSSQPGRVRKANNAQQNNCLYSRIKKDDVVGNNYRFIKGPKPLEDVTQNDKNTLISYSPYIRQNSISKIAKTIKNQKHLIKDWKEDIKIFEHSFEQPSLIPWNNSHLDQYLDQQISIVKQENLIRQIKNVNISKINKRETPTFTTLLNTQRIDHRQQEIKAQTRQCIQNVQNIQQTIKNILKR